MKYNNVLVVLNYNDSKTTINFLENALKCQDLQKIIIVDNFSSDGSYEELLKCKSEKIDVIQTKKNGGYAYGNNYGINYAIENYFPKVCFIANPDVTFENGTIVELQRCLMADNSIAIAAPIVNQGYNLWPLPSFLGVIESLFMVWHNLHKAKVKKELLRNEASIVEVGVVEGSFFAMSVEAFMKAGGFDERTFLYYEENIIAKRVTDLGKKVVALNRIRYNHFHSVSIRKKYKSKAKAFDLFYPSMMLYLKEYLRCGKIKIFLFNIAFKIAHIERYLYDIMKG